MKLKKLTRSEKRKLIIFVVVYFIIGSTFITSACVALFNNKTAAENSWTDGMTMSENAKNKIEAISDNATHVLTGTYVENLKEVNIKNSNFTFEALVWFKWTGNNDLNMADNFRFYEGAVTTKTLLKDSHKDNENYQLVRVLVNVSQTFSTERFPLESHNLHFYLESTYTADKVVLDADTEESSMNKSINIAGYNLTRYAVNNYGHVYDSNHQDPDLKDAAVVTEVIMSMEINRDGWGLYLKCFIALFGTSIWVILTLFLNTYHHVDPLTMIPAALFGAVSNIMVGANLLPDALSMGLLEYTNIFGIMTIIGSAISIITVNRIRKVSENAEFAGLFSRITFGLIVSLTVIGHIMLPLSAYIFI